MRGIEEIPNDGFPKSFYKKQTFVVKALGINEENGETLLVGGRFKFGIAAKRCVKSQTNHNPYPLCRTDWFC